MTCTCRQMTDVFNCASTKSKAVLLVYTEYNFCQIFEGAFLAVSGYIKGQDILPQVHYLVFQSVHVYL